MKKYRIVQTHSEYGGKYYRLEKRIRFICWDYIKTFNTIDEAKNYIEYLELQNNIPKDKVIEYI